MPNIGEEFDAKVSRVKEAQTYGGLTKAEFEEAERLLEPDAKDPAKSRKTYKKELLEAIKNADVIIEVLDARAPQGSRNKELEA